MIRIRLWCGQHGVPLEGWDHQERPFFVPVDKVWWTLDLSDMGCPVDEDSECVDAWRTEVQAEAK